MWFAQIAPGKKELLDRWTRIVRPDRPARARWAGSLLIFLVGIGLLHLLHAVTGKYLSALALAVTACITLYAGTAAGLVSAFAVDLFADFLYIPPIGSVLTNPA